MYVISFVSCDDRLVIYAPRGSNPYEHFSQKGHPCYQKLFDLERIEDEWQPVEVFDL